MSIQQKNGKSETLTIIAICLVAWLFALAVRDYMNLPVVHVSANTGECVNVFDGGGNMKWVDGCDRMPEKYHRVVVP